MTSCASRSLGLVTLSLGLQFVPLIHTIYSLGLDSVNMRERFAVRENELCEWREHFAIRENELSKSSEEITDFQFDGMDCTIRHNDLLLLFSENP